MFTSILESKVLLLEGECKLHGINIFIVFCHCPLKSVENISILRQFKGSSHTEHRKKAKRIVATESVEIPAHLLLQLLFLVEPHCSRRFRLHPLRRDLRQKHKWSCRQNSCPCRSARHCRCPSIPFVRRVGNMFLVQTRKEMHWSRQLSVVHCVLHGI